MYFNRIFVLLFAPFALQCQTWVSDTVIGKDVAGALYKDKWGYIYFLQNGYLTGSKNLTKTNRNGTLQWQLNFPPNQAPNDLACSGDSTIYICGSFQGTLAAGGNTFSSNPGGDPWIARYDAAGNLLWFKTAPGEGLDNIRGIVANDTIVMVTGAFTDTLDFFGQVVNAANQQLFIATLNKLGAPQNIKMATCDADSSYRAQSSGIDCGVDESGNIYVLAYSSGQTYLDTFSLGAGYNGYYNNGVYLVAKLDEQLQTQWVHKFPECYMHCTQYYELDVAPSGRSYVRSHYSYGQSGSTDEFSFIHHISSAGIYVNQYGVNGNSQFYDTYKRNKISDVDIDSCGNVYFCGSSWSYSPGPYYYQIDSSYSMCVQLSPDLQLNWIMKDSSVTMGRLLALSVNDCRLSGAFSNGAVLADTLHVTTPNNGSSNYYFARLQNVVGMPYNLTPYTGQTFCEGSSATLIAISSAPIKWYPDLTSTTSLYAGNNLITPPLAMGTYTYYAEAGTCSMTTGRLPVTVTINPSPNIEVSDGIICHVGAYTISPSSCITYKYSGGGPVVSPASTTNYTVSGSNAWDCWNSAVCTVSVLALPQPTIYSTQNFMCIGQTATLSAVGAASYTWESGTLSQQLVVTPTVNTIYTLTASDQLGCTNSAIFPQFVYDCTLGLDTPMPGQDLKLYPNPTSGALYFELPSNTGLKIFNACGQEVYAADSGAGSGVLDVTVLPAGIYSIHAGGTHTQFVKQQ
jgi:hypothetical protein